MLGSRLEDTGCASCSFVCTLLRGRRKEEKALLSWTAWALLTQPTGGGGR